jgi:hypothetical protein
VAGAQRAPGQHGFVFRDPSATCPKAQLQNGKTGGRLKVACLGAGIGFSLDEPQQQHLTVDLSVASFRYCTGFSGTAVRVDVPGLFQGKRATPPSACPIP